MPEKHYLFLRVRTDLYDTTSKRASQYLIDDNGEQLTNTKFQLNQSRPPEKPKKINATRIEENRLTNVSFLFIPSINLFYHAYLISQHLFGKISLDLAICLFGKNTTTWRFFIIYLSRLHSLFGSKPLDPHFF